MLVFRVLPVLTLIAFSDCQGVPAKVPNVTYDVNIINENNVTLTLSWDEPFNNLDPIVNYTVSCSGDVTCPPNFTTTDNTTRSYNITNLTPMTNYIFSVVATNFIGSGEAGVVMITILGTILTSPGNFIFLPGITPSPIQLTCDLTPVAAWVVNSDTLLLNQLGSIRHGRNGTNIVVNNPMNNSKYFCSDGINNGELYNIFIAGFPAVVSNIAFNISDITIIVRNFSCILSWREPFNNLSPIVNYTVSCSGDGTCPPNCTPNCTTIETNYPLTNLMTNTNYTFSVVATNSIGSGEAGIFNFTTPAIEEVRGIMLTCEPVDQINQCTVKWDAFTQENIIVREYQVTFTAMGHNRTMRNVNNSTTTLNFTAPSLPDDMFTGTVVVMVTVNSSLGIGPPGNKTAEITASSVTDAVIFVSIDLIDNVTLDSSNLTHSTISIDISMINATVVLSSDNMSDPMVMIEDNSDANEVNIIENSKTDTTIIMLHNVTSNTYNMTVISTIHPESEADMVVVTANEKNGTAPVIDNLVKTAIVKIDELKCGTAYTIIAGGIFNNQMLAGPKLNLGSTSNLLCETIENERQNDPDPPIPVIIGGVIAGLVVVIGLTVMIVFFVWFCWCRIPNKSSIQTEIELPLSSPTVKPSETDSKSFTKETKKPTEGPTGHYAEVSKPPKQQPKNTEGAIDYVDLDIEKGPKRFGDPDHIVAYGEITGTNL